MKPIVLYYAKCSTCQKALKWLEEKGVEYEGRPIKEENPTAAELKTWYEKSGLPLKRFRRKKAGSQRLSRSSRPPLPERAALRSRRTISLRPYQNPPQLRTAILTTQYSLATPEQRG